MATDNLNQVGKSIRRIKENADYASKKVMINRQIERSRDVFDSAISFEMEFKTGEQSKNVTLDISFEKPPPRKGCNADCYSSKCETFTFLDGVDHLIQLSSDYVSQTVHVFRNRELLTFVNYYEYDSNSGQVYVQGSGDSLTEITICYVTAPC